MAKKTSVKKKVSSKNVSSTQVKKANSDEILNVISNTSIVLMGTMMGGLTQAMGSIMKDMTSGIAGAMGGEKAADKVKTDFDKMNPETKSKVIGMVVDMRKQMYEQLDEKKASIIELMTDAVFNKGPAIVEKYSFGLPKLTQRLDDDTIAHYMILLESGEPNFKKMFKELMDWMNTLPKPSEEKLQKIKEESEPQEDTVPEDVANEMDKE